MTAKAGQTRAIRMEESIIVDFQLPDASASIDLQALPARAGALPGPPVAITRRRRDAAGVAQFGRLLAAVVGRPA